MKRTRINDRLTFLEPDDMRLFRACAGLVAQGTRKLIIDSNMGPETVPFLLEEKPDAAVISHYHLDHGAWGATVLEHTPAEVFVPSGEERYLTDITYFLDQTAAPSGLVEEWREFSVGGCGYRELKRHTAYEPGDTFSDQGLRIECIDTAGHSPSHRSFYFPEDRVLFTGDMGIDRFGPWYGWEDCDLPRLVATILTLRGLPAEILLTSHGGMLTSGIDDAWQLALQRLVDREAGVAKRLDQGLSPETIVTQGIFFLEKTKVPEPMRSFLTMWDTTMFNHHRDLLHQGGLLRRFPELAPLLPEPSSRKGHQI